MLVIGVNKRNKQWRVHHSQLSTEPVLPISNLSLKTISFTHFTNKINIINLHMKYLDKAQNQADLSFMIAVWLS